MSLSLSSRLQNRKQTHQTPHERSRLCVFTTKLSPLYTFPLSCQQHYSEFLDIPIHVHALKNKKTVNLFNVFSPPVGIPPQIIKRLS